MVDLPMPMEKLEILEPQQMSINNIHGYIFTTCRFIEFFQGSGIRVVPLGGFKEQSLL